MYLTAANNLIQLAVVSGEGSEQVCGDILMIGSFLGDVRSHVFDHIVGFVVEANSQAENYRKLVADIKK